MACLAAGPTGGTPKGQGLHLQREGRSKASRVHPPLLCICFLVCQSGLCLHPHRPLAEIPSLGLCHTTPREPPKSDFMLQCAVTIPQAGPIWLWFAGSRLSRNSTVFPRVLQTGTGIGHIWNVGTLGFKFPFPCVEAAPSHLRGLGMAPPICRCCARKVDTQVPSHTSALGASWVAGLESRLLPLQLCFGFTLDATAAILLTSPCGSPQTVSSSGCSPITC